MPGSVLGEAGPAGETGPQLQLSNFPDVRPARRLLVIGSVLFGVISTLNIAAAVLAFFHHDADRWFNLVRLAMNIVFAVLMWRGFVLLAVLAERAAIYKRVIERDLPRLASRIERQDAQELEHQHRETSGQATTTR